MCETPVNFNPPQFILHIIDTNKPNNFIPYHFSNSISTKNTIKSLLSLVLTIVIHRRQRNTKPLDSVIKRQVTEHCFPHTDQHLQRNHVVPNPFYPSLKLLFIPSHLLCRSSRKSFIPDWFPNKFILTLLALDIRILNCQCSVLSHQLNKKHIILGVRLPKVINLNIWLMQNWSSRSQWSLRKLFVKPK